REPAETQLVSRIYHAAEHWKGRGCFLRHRNGGPVILLLQCLCAWTLTRSFPSEPHRDGVVYRSFDDRTDHALWTGGRGAGLGFGISIPAHFLRFLSHECPAAVASVHCLGNPCRSRFWGN